MFGIARKDDDSAGGAHLAGGQDFVKVEGKDWVLIGDPVLAHGSSPHDSATMTQGSSFVRINGTKVCRENHPATCGHTSTGSSNMKISD